jgi:preprotein translocase subunit SecD
MRTKLTLQTSVLCCVLAFLAITTAVGEPLQVGIASAEQTYDPRNDEPVVFFVMTPSSTRAFAELTVKNVGRKVAIRIDGRVVMTPVINEPIPGGRLQISGNFTPEQAREIAAGLAAGTSKMEMEVVPENNQDR